MTGAPIFDVAIVGGGIAGSTLVGGSAREPSPYSALFIEHYGGRAGRVAADATAFPHPSAPFNSIVLSSWGDLARAPPTSPGRATSGPRCSPPRPTASTSPT
jgi:hypothetical protein